MRAHDQGEHKHLITLFMMIATPHGRYLGGLGFLLFLALFPFSAGAIGGFGGRPAYPREGNARTESIFVHELEPGAVQEEGVRLLNNTGETKTLLVYAVDSTPSTGGAFACRQKSEEKEGVGSWIDLKVSEITIGPSQNEIVPFTIRVPSNASAGEQNGCIMIEEKKPDTEGGGGVNLSFRSGMRVAITIPGDLVRNLEIVGFQVVKQEDGHYLLHPEVRNSGNVSIDTDVNVVTRALFGTLFAEKGGNYPILRGEVSDWNFEIEKPFWGGWFRSSLTVTYDPSVDAGVGVETGGEKTVLQGPTRWFFVVPSWQALLVYAAILLAIAYGARMIMRERQIQKWIAKSWVAYDVQPGETVTGLAERCGVPWKIIARANRLKAPYTLEIGKEIRVPPKLRRTPQE